MIFCGRCWFYVPNMPAKNREKIQPLGPIFVTLCLQGNLTLFSTKLVLAHQAYIGGAPCWGWAWLGGGLSGARAPGHPQPCPNKLFPPNLPHFHQFEPFSSNFFDKFGSFWWIWGRFGGKEGEILLFLTWAGTGQTCSSTFVHASSWPNFAFVMGE